MATIKCTVQRSSWYEVYFEYSYTQDKAKATTTLSHSLKLKQLTDSYDFDTVGSVTVGYKVADKTFSKTGRIDIDDKGNKGYTITLASGSSTITHNSSTGVGSFTVSVDTSIDSAGWGPGTIKLASKTVSLPTIYRASVPTTASSVKMKGTLTINTNRKSSSFTHILKYSFGDVSEITFATGVGESYDWVVPDLASKCNNATNGNATITCLTYNGSTKVGTETCTVTLNVPDASTPSFSASSVVMGSPVTVSTNRKSNNFTHLLEYVFAGKTISSVSSVGASTKYTPALSLAKEIPNDPSGTVTVKCTTYNGTAKVGSTVSKTFTATVPNNETTKPTASWSLAPTGNLVPVFDGLYIQGKTGIKATFTASSTYSTIDTYKLTADGRNFFGNPATSSVFMREGNFTVTGTVTDKRGYSRILTKDVTVLPYNTPTLEPASTESTIICERSLQDGSYDDAGTNLHVKFKAKYSYLDEDGYQKNEPILMYQYKMAGGSWSSRLLFSDWSLGVDEYEGIIPNLYLETDKSYTVRLIIKDVVGSEEVYEFPIPTADVTMHLGEGGYGVAVGKYSEATADNKMFEVAADWNFIVYGDRWKSLGVSESVLASSESNLGRAGNDDCCYRVENGNHVYVAFACGLKWENAVVKVNNVSIPSEYRPKNTVYSFCVCDGRYIAKVGITKAGDVYIASCQDASEGTDTSSVTVGWVDGYVDYFI